MPAPKMRDSRLEVKSMPPLVVLKAGGLVFRNFALHAGIVIRGGRLTERKRGASELSG